MPMHPFFDSLTYPWNRPDAAALWRALSVSIVEPPNRITLWYQRSGGVVPLTPNQAADVAWREVLNQLATGRFLRKFCELIVADLAIAAVHPTVRAVQDARDLLDVPVLPQGIIFLDRKRLRVELDKLSQPPCGMLLVRGPSGCGKSWTQQFITSIATDRGAKSIYLFSGLVSKVEDAVDQLFAMVGDLDAVPTPLETEDAWFRKICVKLQGLAEKTDGTYWVIVDDIGEYEDGPRLDPQIRRFFEQFGLAMGNPLFARRFRLVLLDYPDRAVPTKWKSHFWCEDRPNESDVDVDTIAKFLLDWAAWKEKQLGSEKAVQFAAEILFKVNTPPLPPQVPEPRLKRIHDEVSVVLGTL